MKNKKVLLAIMAVVLVLGMTSCDTGGGGASTEQSAVYSGISGDNAYILTITDSAGKASDTAKAGDAYVLTIIPLSGGTKKESRGTVTTVIGDTLTLASSTTFTVTVSGGNISAISGTIKFDDDTKESVTLTSVTPSTSDTSLVGTWIKDDNEWKYVFGNISYVLAHIDGPNENSGTYITYPREGKKHLITIATLGYDDKIDDAIKEYLPLVSSYEYSISGKTLTLTASWGVYTYTKQ